MARRFVLRYPSFFLTRLNFISKISQYFILCLDDLPSPQIFRFFELLIIIKGLFVFSYCIYSFLLFFEFVNHYFRFLKKSLASLMLRLFTWCMPLRIDRSKIFIAYFCKCRIGDFIDFSIVFSRDGTHVKF